MHVHCRTCAGLVQELGRSWATTPAGARGEGAQRGEGMHKAWSAAVGAGQHRATVCHWRFVSCSSLRSCCCQRQASGSRCHISGQAATTLVLQGALRLWLRGRSFRRRCSRAAALVSAATAAQAAAASCCCAAVARPDLLVAAQHVQAMPQSHPSSQLQGALEGGERAVGSAVGGRRLACPLSALPPPAAAQPSPGRCRRPSPQNAGGCSQRRRPPREPSKAPLHSRAALALAEARARAAALACGLGAAGAVLGAGAERLAGAAGRAGALGARGVACHGGRRPGRWLVSWKVRIMRGRGRARETSERSRLTVICGCAALRCAAVPATDAQLRTTVDRQASSHPVALDATPRGNPPSPPHQQWPLTTTPDRPPRWRRRRRRTPLQRSSLHRPHCRS